jgi:hypothetical protein
MLENPTWLLGVDVAGEKKGFHAALAKLPSPCATSEAPDHSSQPEKRRGRGKGWGAPIEDELSNPPIEN